MIGLFASMEQRKTFQDQMGTQVTVDFPPKRIVSLVPSQTELLATLQLQDYVVGITKFCIHPSQWLKEKTIVGGTKNFDFARLDSLKPDLIIGNKEENYQEGIDKLREQYPVWMSDILTLDDALHMMGEIGRLTNRESLASSLTAKVREDFHQFPKKPSRRVLYLIWRNPWMVAGTKTFIHDMISRMGWSNVVERPRYPVVTNEEIKDWEPEIILLSSEPYPFSERHRSEIQQVCPHAKVILVDGEMFSWYGSRLTLACRYFASLEI